MSGCRARLRSAASTKRTVGRSPQCRSSSTRSDRLRGALGGEEVLPRAAHLVAHQQRRPARAARSCTLSSSGNGAPTSSPRNSATRAAAVADDAAADARARASAGAPRAARRRGCRRRAGARAASIPNGEPAPHRIAAADPDLDGARRAAATRREELVAQARLADARPAPVTSTARATRLVDALGEQRLERAPARARARRTAVGLPSSVRAPSATVALAAAAQARRRRRRRRSARRAAPAVTSSMRDGRPRRRRRAVTPREQRAPRAVDHLADRQAPRRRSAAARSRARSAGPAERRAQRERAAGRLRRLIGRRCRAPRGSPRASRRPASSRRAPRASSRAGAARRRAATAGARASARRRRRRAPRRGPHQHHREHAARSVVRVSAAAAPGRRRRRRRRARRAARAPWRRAPRATSAPSRGRVAGLLGEHARDELVERRGDVGRELAQRAARSSRRIFASDRHQRASPPNAGSPGEALEEHAAEREHVGARVDVRRAARLLGRHVAGRAEHRAGARQPRAPRRSRAMPKSSSLTRVDVAAARKRLHGLTSRWTMPRACAAAERLGDARARARRSRPTVSAPRGEPLREVLALEPLHREVRLARGAERRARRSARCPGWTARRAPWPRERERDSSPDFCSSRHTLTATTSPERRLTAWKTAPMPPAHARPTIPQSGLRALPLVASPRVSASSAVESTTSAGAGRRGRHGGRCGASPPCPWPASPPSVQQGRGAIGDL